MTRRLTPAQLKVAARIVEAPTQRYCTDRTFGLPVGLHTAFFGLFVAYLGVMAIGFPHPEMVIPMAIFLLFTVAFYVVPMLWATMAPAKTARAMRMGELMGAGIDTHTGRTAGGAAVAQVLVLPVLILLWGLVAVAIAHA